MIFEMYTWKMIVYASEKQKQIKCIEMLKRKRKEEKIKLLWNKWKQYVYRTKNEKRRKKQHLKQIASIMQTR